MLRVNQLIGFGVGSGGGGEFPVWEGTALTDTASTSPVINLPSGITANDKLIIIGTCHGNGRFDLDVPSGFTLLEVAGDGVAGETHVSWKTATGSEGSTVSGMGQDDGTASAWIAIRISGAHTDAIEYATAASMNPPSLTPSWGAKKTLWIEANTTRVSSNPSSINWSTGFDATGVQNDYTSKVTNGASWKQDAVATLDPDATSHNGGSGAGNRSWTIAVKPA